jgi:hypothetical protein
MAWKGGGVGHFIVEEKRQKIGMGPLVNPSRRWKRRCRQLMPALAQSWLCWSEELEMAVSVAVNAANASL